MNYYKHYISLIEKCQQRGWTKRTAPTYVERHHIIPKSIGGSDDPGNLVLMTAREHFVGHLLLAKMHGGALSYAAWSMANQKNIYQERDYRISSRIYSFLKQEAAKEIGSAAASRFKGIPKTKEHKRKIADALRGRPNSHKGEVKSEEHISKIVESRKQNGQEWHSKDTKNKIAESLKKIPKLECPWCGVKASPSNAKKWHFDKCKHRPSSV